MAAIWKIFLTCSCISFITCSILHFRIPTILSCTKPKCGLDTKQKSFQDLRIVVIVYDRYQSVLRLLTSLNEAKYDCDKVKLEVWIDRSVNGTVDLRTLQTVSDFIFNHGNYSVHVQPNHVGRFGQWVTTWKLNESSSEIAVILEDDLTVSPYFYKYLKLVHSMYDNSSEINGYALQGVSIKHHVNDTSRLEAPTESTVFLYPVIGTWGFSPNRRNWKNYINWCSIAARNSSFQPYVPENIVTSWFKTYLKQGRTDSMWEMCHIYYAWRHNEFTLYPNFEGHTGLSTHWQEKGLHYSGKEGGATNELLTEWKTEFEHLPQSPVKLDLMGKIMWKEQ